MCGKRGKDVRCEGGCQINSSGPEKVLVTNAWGARADVRSADRRLFDYLTVR
jgi:hypothetical protein